MEVINGLIRNTLDVKRAELIIRALHIAVKNARHTRFDSNVHPKVREVPQYAEPDTPVDELDSDLPAVAAVPFRPVDPRDPHFLERFEEGGRCSPARPPNAKPTSAALPKLAPHNSGKPATRSASRIRSRITRRRRCRR